MNLWRKVRELCGKQPMRPESERRMLKVQHRKDTHPIIVWRMDSHEEYHYRCFVPIVGKISGFTCLPETEERAAEVIIWLE